MKANTPKAAGGDQTLKFGPKGEIDLVEKKPAKKVDKTTKPQFRTEQSEAVTPITEAKQ